MLENKNNLISWQDVNSELIPLFIYSIWLTFGCYCILCVVSWCAKDSLLVKYCGPYTVVTPNCITHMMTWRASGENVITVRMTSHEFLTTTFQFAWTHHLLRITSSFRPSCTDTIMPVDITHCVTVKKMRISLTYWNDCSTHTNRLVFGEAQEIIIWWETEMKSEQTEHFFWTQLQTRPYKENHRSGHEHI